MKKTPIFLTLVIFTFLFIYLHQKVQIYATAFELSRKYDYYQELAAQKDYLRYNFSKKVSLSYVSEWFNEQDFSAPERERVLAFRPDVDGPTQVVQERSFFERLQIPASISDVFARDR